MKKLKIITIDEIRSWEPCYDPSEKLPEGWSGTAMDLLDMTHIPLQDQLWVIMRPEVVSEKLMRLFAVWCARQVQHLMKDKRSVDALDVAERYAKGECTEQDLAAARDAAWDAARAAARDAQKTRLKEMILSGIETGDSVCEEEK